MDHPPGWEAAGSGGGGPVSDSNKPICGQGSPTVSAWGKLLGRKHLGCAFSISVPTGKKVSVSQKPATG